MALILKKVQNNLSGPLNKVYLQRKVHLDRIY